MNSVTDPSTDSTETENYNWWQFST